MGWPLRLRCITTFRFIALAFMHSFFWRFASSRRARCPASFCRRLKYSLRDGSDFGLLLCSARSALPRTRSLVEPLIESRDNARPSRPSSFRFSTRFFLRSCLSSSESSRRRLCLTAQSPFSLLFSMTSTHFQDSVWAATSTQRSVRARLFSLRVCFDVPQYSVLAHFFACSRLTS